MANRILVYDSGKNLGLAGTVTGQVVSWNDTNDAWEVTTPSSGGTVTSVTAGTGLSGGTITTSGTISANFGSTTGTIAQGDDNRFPPAPAAAGRIIYDTGVIWQALSAGTEGKVLTAHGAAAPTWETPAAGGVTQVSTGTGLTGGPITTTGTISLAALDPAPTGSYGSASAVPAITVDTYGRVTGVVSTNIAIDAAAITSGTLGVARGGTGLATIPVNEVLIGNGTAAISSVALGDGELLIGDTGGAPQAATLTAGTGVAIVNAAHSITLSIGQAVATTDSPTFVGLTLSGASADRFLHTNGSKAITALGNGASKLVGYNASSEASVISLGTGLSMTGSTLNGTEGTVTSVAASSPLTINGSATTTPTVAFSNQNANVVLAGPVTSPAAAPTFRSLVIADLPALPYDVSGEAASTPDTNTTVFHFKSARAWTLKGTGHVAGCESAPSDTISFTISKGGSPIGTIQYSVALGTNGTVTITSGNDTAFAINEILTVTSPADLKTIVSPFWTFLGTCP